MSALDLPSAQLQQTVGSDQFERVFAKTARCPSLRLRVNVASAMAAPAQVRLVRGM